MFPSATILPCHPLDNPAHLDYHVEHKFYTYSMPIRGYTYAIRQSPLLDQGATVTRHSSFTGEDRDG